MTIQRTGYEIAVHQHNTDPNRLIVEMIIECQGEIVDRGDAMLMIGEA